MKITFTVERETKGTFRYTETAHDGKKIEQDEAFIGSLYVKKSAAQERQVIEIEFPVVSGKKAKKD